MKYNYQFNKHFFQKFRPFIFLTAGYTYIYCNFYLNDYAVNFSESPAKVLIVDDEPNILIAIEFLLRHEGYQTEKAYNGLQALELAARFLPDIVILDVMMPGMDGFEVAHQIRQMPSLEYTKIIFLTAKGTQRDKETGYAKGAEAYMLKPFDNEELVTVVNEMLTFG